MLSLAVMLVLAACPAHTYPDGRGVEGQLEREVVALHARVRMLEQSCEQSGAPDRLYSELHTIFADSAVKVSREGNTTVAVLPVAHLFGADHALRDEAHKELDLLATALRVNPDHSVTIIGHTDDALLKGALATRFEDPVLYSTWLAWLVERALVQDFQLDPARIVISGRGPYQPLATNDTPAGQALNRRVEIRVRPERLQ